MSQKPPIYSIFCIDYRFDAMVATFYENTGNEFNYFASTAAGGALSLGYEKYCKTCSKIRCCMCNKQLQQPQPLICYSCAFKYS